MNDASLIFDPETSGALGFGFRCGFLGLLHMDIVQERLEREYNIELIGTAPTVKYNVELTDNSSIEVDNPSKWPENQKINQVFEPWIKLSIISPSEYIGPITELVTSNRGEFINTEWIQSNTLGSQLSGSRVLMEFDIPLSETIKALRKNVTAKCYGGDITRKRKLLAKQSEGKKRMKKVGSVEVPQEAFMSILKSDKQE